MQWTKKKKLNNLQVVFSAWKYVKTLRGECERARVDYNYLKQNLVNVHAQVEHTGMESVSRQRRMPPALEGQFDSNDVLKRLIMIWCVRKSFF